MSATKTTAGLVTLLAIGVGLSLLTIGTAIHESRAVQRKRAQLAAANSDFKIQQEHMRALQREGQNAEKTVSDLNAEIADLRSNPEAAKKLARRMAATVGAAARSAGAGGGADSTAGLNNAAALAEGQKFLANFPQVRALMMANAPSGVMKIFAPFIRNAALTPSQATQLENLIASTWVGDLQISATAMAAGPAEPSLDQLSAIMGPQLAQQFQDYGQTMRYPYEMIAPAAAIASLSGAPLSDQQTDQLAQIIANNSAAYKMVPGALGPVNFNAAASAVNWENVIAQAQAVLPPAQFNAAQGALLRLQFGAALSQAQAAANSSP